MRFAVTGASGFLGHALCTRLLARGDEVHAYDLRADTARLPGTPVRAWDIAGGPLPGAPAVDAVVHTAAFVSDTGDDGTVRRVNVDGTGHVAASFPGARFVHISTCSVYDPHREQRMATEAEAPAPEHVRWTNAYGRTKAEAERLLARIRPEAVLLRPHAIYGPGDTTLQPRMRVAGRRGRLPIPGHGRQRHSITSVGNLVAACLLAAEPDAPPGVYNVSDPEPVLLATVLAALATTPGQPSPRITPLPELPLVALAAAAELGSRLAGRLTGTPRRPPLSRYTVEHLARERTFDISAARERLGYRPEPSILAQAATW